MTTYYAKSQNLDLGEMWQERTPRELEGPRRSSTTLSVVVPVYNEQFLVETSLARLRVLGDSSLLDRVQVIVIDDASKDKTPQALARFHAAVESGEFADPKFSWVWLRHEKNSGKGAAVRTGLAHADGELVVIHDADLEYHPRDLLKMVEVFIVEDADAVFGSRFMAGGYKRALFFRHSLGNKFLTLLCDLFCDLNLTDMETCYKMVRTSLIQSIPLESSTFDLEPELTIKLAKRGSRIFEVPISYSGRTYAEGKKIGWRDGFRALWAISRYSASSNIYAGGDKSAEVLEPLNRAPRFNRWKADVVKACLGDRVLDVGAGTGNISMLLMPRSLYWATDVDPNFLEFLAIQRPTRPYMRVAYADVERPETLPQGQNFDTVVCLNVLEYVADDVSALRSVSTVLDSGGRVVVSVPANPALYGSLDEALGHRRRYTGKQLIQAAEQAGFRIEKIIEFNRLGAVGWWLDGRISKRKKLSAGQMRALNFWTPLFRATDSWLPLPALSLIAVLRKGA